MLEAAATFSATGSPRILSWSIESSMAVDATSRLRRRTFYFRLRKTHGPSIASSSIPRRKRALPKPHIPITRRKNTNTTIPPPILPTPTGVSRVSEY